MHSYRYVQQQIASCESLCAGLGGLPSATSEGRGHGHTRSAHGRLLHGEPAPVHAFCGEPPVVSHIPVECHL